MSPIGPLLPPAPPPLPAGMGQGSITRGSISAGEQVGSAGKTNDATSDFSKLLIGKFEEVNSMQNNADNLVHQMLTGGNVNQAEVLTAVQKADLAFRMMLQVRNKLIEAYRELQQIQI